MLTESFDYVADNSDNIAIMQANGHHPTAWDDFVGQDEIKDQLRAAAAAARRRADLTGKPVHMGHKIIVSPEPGVGKTSLALLAAAEAGAGHRIVKGVVTEGMAVDLLDDIGDGGVLIWDEFQQAVSGGKRHLEWLYHYAQQGVFMSGDEIEPAPRVSIIAATTDLGDLPTAVKERFSVLQLAPYTQTEAAGIASSTWAAIGSALDVGSPAESLCHQVATAASRRPRYMQRIWEKVENLVMLERLEVIYTDDGFDVDLTVPLKWAGLTPDGLTMNCQKYMAFLRGNDRPRGVDTIKNATGITKSDLTEVESLLTEKGYVDDTGMGRRLTTAGRRRLRQLMEVAA